MESTAFLSRPRRRDFREEPALGCSRFACGQPVTVSVGPLAGMQGTLLKQASDGRWMVQLLDLAAGVLLCVHADHLRQT